MSNPYTHRQAGPPPPTGAPTRLIELLDAMKAELENYNQDAAVFKIQRDEFEHKINSQINEMTAFQQTLFEIERNHQKLKQQYEDEILRLRREIEQRGGHPPGGSSNVNHLPPPSIGHGPSSLFGNIVGGAPPQLVDPAQTQQPQQHPSFPPPSSNNPSGPHHYLTGGGGGGGPPPPGSQPHSMNHPSHLPPNGPGGMHMNKRPRADSEAGGALPMMQQGGGGGPTPNLPPSSYGAHPSQPPSNHHKPPGMYPTSHQSLNQGKMTPTQNQPPPSNPAEPNHPSHLAGGGPPHLSAIPPNVSQGAMQRKNGTPGAGGPPISGAHPITNPARPPFPASPAPAAGTPSLTAGLSDLDPDSVPAQHKREGGDWFAIFNPKVPRVLNVELLSTLDHNSVVCCVRFSADGKYLATGCNRTAQIYETSSASKICVLIDDSVNKNDDLYIRSVCFSPDGKYLATGAEDKLIRIWDIKKKFIVHLFQGHEQDIYSLDFSRDGRFIVSGSGDRTARLWDMESRKCLFTLAIDDMNAKDAGVTSVALSPDGRFVAAGSLDKVVRIWDSRSGQLLDKLEGHKDSVYSVAFSADGKTLSSGALDKAVKLWDLSSLSRGPTPGPKGSVTCRSTLSGHKDFVLSVACSPCNNWVVSGSKDRGVQFWDPRTSQIQFMLQGHKNSVISVALSPVGKLFATGSGDCRARLWSYEGTPPLLK